MPNAKTPNAQTTNSIIPSAKLPYLKINRYNLQINEQSHNQGTSLQLSTN